MPVVMMYKLILYQRQSCGVARWKVPNEIIVSWSVTSRQIKWKEAIKINRSQWTEGQRLGSRRVNYLSIFTYLVFGWFISESNLPAVMGMLGPVKGKNRGSCHRHPSLTVINANPTIYAPFPWISIAISNLQAYASSFPSEIPFFLLLSSNKLPLILQEMTNYASTLWFSLAFILGT